MPLRNRGRSPSSLIDLNRSSSISRTIRPSRRASGAPRQWWIPPPNERCRPWRRSMSRRSGLTNTSGSPVGRAQKEHDVVAFPQRKAVHLAVREHTPKIGLHRRVEAQQLFHCRRDQARVLPESLKLIGIANQGQDAVADQVGRGLGAGAQEQAQHVQRLAFAQLFTFRPARAPGR